jgi:hypothetical protein
MDKQALAAVTAFHLAYNFQGKAGRSLDGENREGVLISCGR